MRNLALRGFAFLGAISTVLWIVSLFTSNHHRPVWELLSVGLACFLASACVEIVGLKRVLVREGRRDDLLGVIDHLTRECQGFQGSMADYAEWLERGEVEIAEFSLALATEWAQIHAKERVGPPLVAVSIRLEKLQDIRRAVMTPNSHLGRSAADGLSSSGDLWLPRFGKRAGQFRKDR